MESPIIPLTQILILVYFFPDFLMSKNLCTCTQTQAIKKKKKPKLRPQYTHRHFFFFYLKCFMCSLKKNQVSILTCVPVCYGYVFLSLHMVLSHLPPPTFYLVRFHFKRHYKAIAENVSNSFQVDLTSC